MTVFLMVATDRISAFELHYAQRHPAQRRSTGHRLSHFWFDQMNALGGEPSASRAPRIRCRLCSSRTKANLARRAIDPWKKAQPLPRRMASLRGLSRPVQAGRNIAKSPDGLRHSPAGRSWLESSELPEPIFTPATNGPQAGTTSTSR